MHPLHRFLTTLAPVSERDFAQLLPHVLARPVDKGEHLLRAGQVCEAVYFVTAGLLRMYYTDPEGHVVNCRFAGPNGFLTDYQSFLTQQPSRYGWQALHATEVIPLSHTLVQRMYQVSPIWSQLGRLMAEQVYLQLNERVEMLQFYTPTQRYEYMQRQHPNLLAQVSQAQLASYLGIRPESLSRIRQRLARLRRADERVS